MGVFGQYKGYELNDGQIRYAMQNTVSNKEAARWLHVSFSTWKKYARMYKDEATGKNLYDLHRDTGMAQRAALPKVKYNRKGEGDHVFVAYKMEDVFANKYPRYSLRTFKNRLIHEGWLEERCSCCGFQERRKEDYTMPLKLHWVDGNQRNYELKNIQLLCFNCYYIYVGNPWGAEKHFTIDETTGEPVPVHSIHHKSIPVKTGPYYVKGKNR